MRGSVCDGFFAGACRGVWACTKLDDRSLVGGIHDTQFDIKNKRVFLRRCAFPSVSLEDLFIGAKVTVYARQMTLIEYGDSHTKELLGNTNEIAFGLVPPASLRSIGKVGHAVERYVQLSVRCGLTRRGMLQILAAVHDARLQVSQLRMVQLNERDAEAVGSVDLAAGSCVPLQLVGLHSCEVWGKLARSCTSALDCVAWVAWLRLAHS